MRYPLAIIWAFMFLVVGIGPCTAGAADRETPKTRNPFGVADVPDPDGKDVQELAAKVKLCGDDKDPNAEQWAPKETQGK
jgi:hypothetical protein